MEIDNVKKGRKIAEIMRNPSYNNSRAINTILSALQVGIPLADEERLFNMVNYVYLHSRPRRMLSKMRHTFQEEYGFLLREFKGIEEIPDELYKKYVTKQDEVIK